MIQERTIDSRRISLRSWMNHMDEKTIKANVSIKLDDSLVPAEAQPFLSPENRESPPPLQNS